MNKIRNYILRIAQILRIYLYSAEILMTYDYGHVIGIYN